MEVVDTTAAGDTFIGYFIAEISNGTPTTDAIKLATAASALTVSKKGASTSIPSKNDVENVLEALKIREQLDPREEKLKDRVTEYIDSNISDARLGELARILGYSEAYTGRIIQRICGECFSKLLQNRRCELAKGLLIESDMSVEEIISCVGYENESFFRALFKKKYGVTPYQYKKQMKRGKI